MSTPTTYLCTSGTISVQSTGTATETGFTGSCGAGATCSQSGNTYNNGQTWTVNVTSTQAPTSLECPSGAGTRVDDMSTPTTYLCTTGTISIQSTGATTETGFTGACGASSCTMYVVDKLNDNVQEFTVADMSATYLSEFGSEGSGNGQFGDNGPQGVSVLNNGTQLLITDNINSRVEVFNTNGTYVSDFGSNGTNPGQFENLTYAAQAPSGRIFVTDYESPGTTTVFNSSYSSPVQSVGIIDPVGIAFDAAGNAWVGEANDVVEVDSNGNEVPGSSFGTFGSGPGQFGCVAGIAFDTSGRMFAADTDNARVEVWVPNGSGSYNYSFDFGTYGTGDGQFTWPSYIQIDTSGHVWVSDGGNARIEEFDLNGNYRWQFGTYGAGGPGAPTFGYPVGIALSKSCVAVP